MANYSFGIKPLPEVQNGHTFEYDNFTQLYPHTKIFEGITGLTFVNCRLVNCDLPEDAVTIGCQPKQANFCTNVHPHLVNHGLSQCADNCDHVTNTDTVTIDGVAVATIYSYSDEGVS